MTTAVYFDLDGTLLTYDVEFDELVARTLPGDAPDAAVDTYTESVLAALTERAPDPYARAFRAVCEDHGLDADPAALAEAYVEREVAATRVPNHARRLVETVAERHPTGILTNGDGRVQRRKLRAHGLDDAVDAVLVSNDLGVRKPDPAVFERARERLPADTHLYVGDSYAEDVEPAREAGFRPVYVGAERRAEAAVSAAGVESLADVVLPLLD